MFHYILVVVVGSEGTEEILELIENDQLVNDSSRWDFWQRTAGDNSLQSYKTRWIWKNDGRRVQDLHV